MTRSEVTQKWEHVREIEEGRKDDGHWRTEGTDGTVVPMSLRRVIYCLNVVGTRASLQLENRLHCAKFNKAIHASTSRFLSFSTAIARLRLERPMKVTVRVSQLRNYVCGTKSYSISPNISLALTNLFIHQMQKRNFFFSYNTLQTL